MGLPGWCLMTGQVGSQKGMTMHRIVCLLVLAFAVALVPAMADTFTFTFTTTGEEVDYGTLEGPYDCADCNITWGAITITNTELGWQGTAEIFPNPSLYPYPSPFNPSLSPLGDFFYDDVLSPGQDPPITNAGLLFVGPSGIEVNIFSNGPGQDDDQEYLNNGNSVSGTFNITSRKLPEPGVASLLFTMLAGVGGLAGFLKKRLT
jgi:hypothetical protein